MLGGVANVLADTVGDAIHGTAMLPITLAERWKMAYGVLRETGPNPISSGWNATLTVIADITGVTQITDGIVGRELFTGRQLTGDERAQNITLGSLQLITSAYGIMQVLKRWPGLPSPGKNGGISGANNPNTLAQTSGRGIWDLTPEERWTSVEQRLGKNLPGNFKTIDKFDNGIATSIKSMDLEAPTYAKSEAITSVGQRYVDKLARYKGGKWAGITIDPARIQGRALDLAVPPGASSLQKEALQGLVDYGKKKGIIVNTVEMQ